MIESNFKGGLLRRWRGWFIVAFAVLLSGYGLVKLARHEVPVGQPALVRLNAGNFHVLTDRFNSGSDRARVLVMLSPT